MAAATFQRLDQGARFSAAQAQTNSTRLGSWCEALSQFQELLAKVRVALEKRPAEAQSPRPAETVLPVSAAARRARLGSRSIQQVEAVPGRVVKATTEAAACAAIGSLCRERGVSRIAI